jgi:murein DD-endopeptidase MepM/ murein hydrolase activator NlpD
MTLRSRLSASLLAAAGISLLAGCDDLRRAAEDLIDQRTPRQKYIDALGTAGLLGTALTVEWTAAGDRALHAAPLVSSPHEEQGYLSPGEPAAIAMRVRVRRGQEVTMDVDLPGDSTTTVFLDAWVLDGDSLAAPRHLESADSGQRVLSIEPRRDGEIIFRAQPELLRGGRFRATLRLAPTLAFPIRPGNERDIGSRFGAPRDAGRRSHHGIDIFAPRGTPVVAAAEGIVNRVNETAIGGKVVWLRDVNGNSLYYAHLDRQAVNSGQRVAAGDTLGFVGNTGNARTTPPHLHFGVYRRGEGPVDPYWFVHRPSGVLPQLVADTQRIGDWIRAADRRTPLLAGTARGSDTVLVLQAAAAMRVLSAAGSWYRVRLPDGVTGFIDARRVEAAVRPIATIAATGPLLARPAEKHEPGNVIDDRSRGEPVGVLGRFGEFALVRSSRGVEGWVSSQ